VFELFALSDPIRELILARRSANIICDQAVKEGMITIRQDGWRKVLAGQTTPEEVARVSASTGLVGLASLAAAHAATGK
jgi:type II secretory ATPase GspE/PulE/Tfp pilus assembly ATPase PilB-like protein